MAEADFSSSFVGGFASLEKSLLQQKDFTFLGVLIALAVLLITIVVLKLKRRKDSKRTILIVGICNAGKTLVFNRLVHGNYVHTYTSMKENTGPYSQSGGRRSLMISDLPGHDKVRNQYFDRYKANARAVLYVVDSVAFPREVKEVAELLYSLLADKVISSSCPPFLVACNKHDITTAKSASLIKTQLEKEINTLRITKSGALGGLGDGGQDKQQSSTFLGKQGQDFEFTHLSSIKIEFVECSAKGDSQEDNPEMATLHEWLNRIA